MAEEILTNRLNNDDTKVEATTEPKETPIKKQRKPREKVRTVEETIDLPVSKLSDKEKEQLIKHLKEETNLLRNKSEACKETADKAFERIREAERTYDEMEKFYRRKLQYVSTQLEAFHMAINSAIKGGAM